MNRDSKYAEIINLPHHVSETKPHMSMIDRAAQFSPFAALTGHNAALDETARLTDTFVELDEDEKEILDAKMHMLMDFIDEKPEVTVIYFKPDEKKSGGAYITVNGYIKRVNILRREIIMNNETVIPVDSVSDIRGEIFDKTI
ncbi:MAG: hypothetical protein IJZ07_01565 [Clostridia bacterium]|nr:hypothetical protein [Clostridia bacterium]